VEPPPAERPGVKSLTHQQKGTKTPAETITHTRHDQTRQTHERSRLRQYDQASLADNLRIALSSRSTIDQAIGIIIGLQRCTPGMAFDVLRAASQHRNVPLRKIAAELVESTIGDNPQTSSKSGESTAPPGTAKVRPSS
jgi:hypothetical protein